MTNLKTFGRFTSDRALRSRPIRAGKVSVRRTIGIIFVFAFCAAAVTAAPAQTFTVMKNFNYTNGANPFSLIQATDGNFYGTTYKGGTGPNYGCNVSCGTIFKITTGGTLTTIHSFDSTDGNGPAGTLVQATDGLLYGTTTYGGANDCTSFGQPGGCGAIFKTTLGGALTVLYNFCAKTNCADGAIPWAGLVQATDGNFYGTTSAGGTGSCNNPAGPGCGAVFKITSGGAFTTLHSFNNNDGAYPYGALVQGIDGNFYGTTYGGGTKGYGTVFKITPGGTLTTLHSFSGSDGAFPSGGLVQAANGNLYGTTSAGNSLGEGPSCTPSGVGGNGTVFQITPGGTLTNLHSFNGTDGSLPYARLVLASDQNFYGLTACGGANGVGALFKMTAGGVLTTPHSFDKTNGEFPLGLMQGTNGIFYGTAIVGGTSNDGTIYSFAVGLGSYVQTQPTSGKLAAAVTILGTNLTGTTSVTFNGTAAKFTVVSSSKITTSVPAGAKTGTVYVTTPSAKLKSNVIFRVIPQISGFTPTSGAVGTSVTISGSELTQASKVTFGGVKAITFTVNSDSKVTAIVPTGAKTGKITITTPGGTATSAGTFTIT